MAVGKVVKVTAVWATVVYVVCVLLAWLLPAVYLWGARNMVHFGMVTATTTNLTFAGVIQGLIIWDVVAVVMVWLFVWLYNKMK